MTIPKSVFLDSEVERVHQNRGNLAHIAEFFEVGAGDIQGTMALNGGRENGFRSVYGVIARPGGQQLMTDNGPADAHLVISRLGIDQARAFVISYKSEEGRVRTMNTVLSLENGPTGDVLRVIDIFPDPEKGAVDQFDNTLLLPFQTGPGMSTRIYHTHVGYTTISDHAIENGRVVEDIPTDDYLVRLRMTPNPQKDQTSAREIENTLAAIMRNKGSGVTLLADE